MTYDLVIAKIALRIQSAKDDFKKLFINFGPFHTMLSFLKACGKFISGSGLMNLFIDSEILAGECVHVNSQKKFTDIR